MPPRGWSDPGQGSGPPRYAGSFLLAFREATEALNWQVRRWHGDLVECLDADGHEHTVGLENLYRRARREGRDQWPALIKDFLGMVLSLSQGDTLPTDLSSVAERVLVRLGQPLKRLPDSARVYARPLEGTNLVINLVIDHPNRMCYVTEELVANSGRAGEDWLECALANLHERTPQHCFQVVHPESGLLLCSVADAYDSSRALLLDRLLPDARAGGCLVVLPGRDELLVLPVNHQTLAHVQFLKVVAEKNFRSVPYPISDQVYWVYNGVWHPFVIDLRASSAVVTPPALLAEILARLPAADEHRPEKPAEGDGA